MGDDYLVQLRGKAVEALREAADNRWITIEELEGHVEAVLDFTDMTTEEEIVSYMMGAVLPEAGTHDQYHALLVRRGVVENVL
jgi:glyoxylate utilization-related uncharacterized protein